MSAYAKSTPVTLEAPKGPHGQPCLLCDYGHVEATGTSGNGNRVVVKNDDWLAVVPWWAVWPFEVLREYMAFAHRPTLTIAIQFFHTSGTFHPFFTSARLSV